MQNLIKHPLPSVFVQKRFVVTSSEDQKKIPFARVNHNKYMVTDHTAYIGTSNWSGDYFTTTAGIGLVLHDEDDEPHVPVEHQAATTTPSEASTTNTTNADGAARPVNATAEAAPHQREPKRTLRSDLLAVFERDWNSMYALELAKV